MIKWLCATPPVVGSRWSMDPDNPFDKFTVTVLAIKRGWVQYNAGRGVVMAKSIRDFRSMYTELHEDVQARS